MNVETKIRIWATKLANRVSRTFIITSCTCPWATLSSTSASALRCSGECGKAPCILENKYFLKLLTTYHGSPPTDNTQFKIATTNISRCWYPIPFFSLKWKWWRLDTRDVRPTCSEDCSQLHLLCSDPCRRGRKGRNRGARKWNRPLTGERISVALWIDLSPASFWTYPLESRG